MKNLSHAEPVNARLLDVATGKTPHLYEGRCPDYVNGPESRDPDCPACQAIVSADAQQGRLLQDMHDAGREIDRAMAEPTPKAERLMEWQPIESAPPNEILLLACEFDGPGDWRIKCGYYDEENKRGWKVWGASWTPTRWMKMPPAPETAAIRKNVFPTDGGDAT